jgi:hypothetical protein
VSRCDAADRRGPPHALHATGEQAIPFSIITEKIGERLGILTRSITAEQAAQHFDNPFMALVYATDAPASSNHTRELLGWAPNHLSMLDDLEKGRPLRRQT